MSAPARFLFDIDFDAPKPANTISLSDHQSRIAEAETDGYRKGFAAGQQEAQGDSNRRLIAALEAIARSLGTLAQGLSAVEDRLETEAVEVAAMTGRKLAATLIEREPMAEITALAASCFRELIAIPHVVVRVNDALYEDAKDQLGEIARQSGFEGRLLILAEPDIGIGDCQIEWADGGMIRNRSDIDDKIDATIRRFIDAKRHKTNN